jgi:hypothetical protein
LTNTSNGYAAGDSFAIFTGTNISGLFDTILPAYTGEGLAWDTSVFYKQGTLKVDTIITGTTTTPVDTLPNLSFQLNGARRL